MPPGRGQLSLSALLEAAAASNPPTRCQSSPKPGPSSCRALPGPPTTHPRLSVDQLARQLRDLCVEPTCLLLLTESSSYILHGHFGEPHSQVKSA